MDLKENIIKHLDLMEVTSNGTPREKIAALMIDLCLGANGLTIDTVIAWGQRAEPKRGSVIARLPDGITWLDAYLPHMSPAGLYLGNNEVAVITHKSQSLPVADASEGHTLTLAPDDRRYLSLQLNAIERLLKDALANGPKNIESDRNRLINSALEIVAQLWAQCSPSA